MADKEKMEEEKMNRERKYYSENLQKQIRENELVRIKERKAFFEEGVKLDDEAKARRAKLDDIKKKKLNELRFVILNHFCFDFFVGVVVVAAELLLCIVTQYIKDFKYQLNCSCVWKSFVYLNEKILESSFFFWIQHRTQSQ